MVSIGELEIVFMARAVKTYLQEFLKFNVVDVLLHLGLDVEMELYTHFVVKLGQIGEEML